MWLPNSRNHCTAPNRVHTSGLAQRRTRYVERWDCHEVPLFSSSFPSLAPNSLLALTCQMPIPWMPIYHLPDACSIPTWSLSHIIVLSLFLYNTFTYSLYCYFVDYGYRILDSLLSFPDSSLVSTISYCSYCLLQFP